MNVIKNKYYYILIVIFILSANYFLNLNGRKFCPENLLASFPQALQNQGSLNISILEQPFSFLGEGAQCYVFASQDERYVIKLFKVRHFKPQKKWLKEGPLFRSLIPREKREQSARNWERKFQESCERYALAHDHLLDETGLIYLHFEKEESKLPVQFSFSGKTYTLDLAKLPFIVQEKGELVPDKISRLMKEGNAEAAIQALARLHKMLEKRTQKKFTDPRQCFSVNFAFNGEKPLQIDVGKITYDPKLDCEAESQKICDRLDQWIEKHFPDLN